MEDHPAQAFRRKKDSSVHVGARLVKDRVADAFVSAGNTGAVMTTAKFIMGTLASVDRVALAAPFPNAKGGVSVLLDVGANVDSKPEHLLQFGVMGEIYYRVTFGSRKPRVGLLSVGEEEMKGNELTRAVYDRLKALPVHFVGNVEGGDLFSGKVDVIVCDGFVGNIALKICEGLGDGGREIPSQDLQKLVRFAGRLSIVERRDEGHPAENGLFGVRRSAVIGRTGRVRDRSRKIERECGEECHSCSRWPGARAHQ